MVYNCKDSVVLERIQTQMSKLSSEYTNYYCSLVFSGYKYLICSNQHALCERCPIWHSYTVCIFCIVFCIRVFKENQ